MPEIEGYIQRKTMLYKTGVEYGDYTINFVLGCSHGCKYPCYAYTMKKRFGIVKTYEEWRKPKLVKNTLELLDKEIPRLKNKIRSVHLCFTTDPFMYGYDEVCEMGIASIQKFNNAGIKCSVLTKGILPMELTQFSKENEYGITLISLNEEYRKRMEPYAAPYKERLAALQALHAAGCKTWVSMEPYPTPNILEQDLHELLEAVSFVDKIIFGRTNYSKVVSAYKGYEEFYNKKAAEVIAFCKERNIGYHIKDKTITEK
ncbi:MAG: radical SAM protein [Lachnospiraceae bacterium]|nr:radical SAM protein [Lachnospiraceae bacterium]